MNLFSFFKKGLPTPIYVTNTLSGQKERFEPLSKGKVGMYNCGPTVYDYAHIGNLRAYVFADILRRTLEREGYSVEQVMNMTDIGHLSGDTDAGEDKMVSALQKMNLPATLESLKTVGDKFSDAFKEDIEKLNIESPEKFPRPSDHIPEQIALVQVLIDKGFAYQTKNGVYFNISKFPDYGKLGRLNLKGNEAGTRVEVDHEKRDPRDFVLWKLGGSIGWESPWGVGFPGWHIECSAMSVKYLGQPFDIHTGGIDHISIHHQNEIAQSEAAAGKPLARYWLHNAFLTVDGEKMTKSSGDFLTLRDVESEGYDPLSLRYLYLTAHYRSPLSFSWQSLDAAENALTRLKTHIHEWPEGGAVDQTFVDQFADAMRDDLNTPEALANIWEMVRGDMDPAIKRASLLEADKILGLRLDRAPESIEISEEVRNLIELREKAREEKEWDKADTLRKEIEALGYTLKDTPTGSKISRV